VSFVLTKSVGLPASAGEEIYNLDKNHRSERPDEIISGHFGRPVDLRAALENISWHKWGDQERCSEFFRDHSPELDSDHAFEIFYQASMVIQGHTIWGRRSGGDTDGVDDHELSDMLAVRALASIRIFNVFDRVLEKNKHKKQVLQHPQRALRLVVFLAMVLEQSLGFRSIERHGSCDSAEPAIIRNEHEGAPTSPEASGKGKNTWPTSYDMDLPARETEDVPPIDKMKDSLAFHLAYALRDHVSKTFPNTELHLKTRYFRIPQKPEEWAEDENSESDEGGGWISGGESWGRERDDMDSGEVEVCITDSFWRRLGVELKKHEPAEKKHQIPETSRDEVPLHANHHSLQESYSADNPPILLHPPTFPRHLESHLHENLEDEGDAKSIISVRTASTQLSKEDVARLSHMLQDEEASRALGDRSSNEEGAPTQPVDVEIGIGAGNQPREEQAKGPRPNLFRREWDRLRKLWRHDGRNST
jgi:hypothetical protein